MFKPRVTGFIFVFKEVTQTQHHEQDHIIPSDVENDMGHMHLIIEI